MQKQSGKEPGLAKFLRFGIYLTAFVVPLVIFREFISPFHFGKVVVFRSLVEILGAAYFILILQDRSYLPRRDKIFWAFLFFVTAFTITTLTSVLRYPSFWGTLERMGGLWTFWHYFIFFMILNSVLTSKEHWRKILDFTILAGVLSAFYGFGQKTSIDFFLGSGNRTRIFGTIGNAALFAGYQLLVTFLSLMFYFNSKNTYSRRIFYVFAFVVTSIAIMMTAVRGSVLGYGVGLIAFAFLWMRHKKSRAGKLILNALFALVILFFVFALLFNHSSFVKNSGYLNRLTDLSLKSTTVQTRFWAWGAGLKGWSEGPKTIIFGWGPENFNIPFSKNFNPKFFAGPGAETLFDRAHNMFIEILVTMGFIGLLSYLNIFRALFVSFKKLQKNADFAIYGIGLTSLTIAYIIHNSFIFDTSANFIVFFTVVGFVSYLNFNKEPVLAKDLIDKENRSSRFIIRKRLFINMISVVLIVVIPVLIYKTNVLPARANYATTRAITRGWQGDTSGAFEKYREALSYNVPGKYEYRHRLAQFLVGTGGPSVKEEKVREMYKYTLTEIDRNIEENSIDYLPYLYASRLNIVLGKDDPKSPYNDEALKYSLKALELSPTFIRTYFEIAQAYLNKRNYPKAIEYFQKAVDLNPDTGVSHAYLGSAKIESGDLSGSEDLERALASKNGYNPSELDFTRLVSAYVKANDFARVAWVYEQMIKINPKNPQHYASLATSYAKLGRIDDAVEMARKAAIIDSSFRSDAEKFVESLGRKL